MATGIICRRFAGRPCRTAAFSTTAKDRDKTVFFRKTEEGQHTQRTGKDPKPPATLRLWKPPGYRVSINPSAYLKTKGASHTEASRDLEGGSSQSDNRIGSKQFRNAFSVTCSRKLSSAPNPLQYLKSSKALPPRGVLIQPTKQDPLKEERKAADVEAYNPKEDPRAFQTQRPEYKALCCNCSELPQSTSMEECDLILQKIAVLKSSLKPSTIAEYFFRLSCLPKEQHESLKSNSRFAMLCRYGIENIRQFDIPELLMVLKAFACLAVPPSHSMLHVYEVECCRRAWDMSLEQQLLVADLWRCIGYSVPRYLDIVLSYVTLHWKDVTLPQLVQLIYIIGEGRKAPEELMQKLDILVLMQLDSLSLEEVGAICLGFFKSHNGLSEQTMRKIGDKVSAHMAEISTSALVNILKMYRYTHIDHLDFLKQLGNVVPPLIPTIGIQGVMHITLACSALHYLDERIMDAVAASLPSRAVHCRSKDVAKFLWSFGCLNYEPPNAEELYASLEDQMRAKLHEAQKFPEHMLTSLLALAFAKRFPKDLIDYALSPEFIRLTSDSKFELQKDLFTLDGSVEIECPSYRGNRLVPQFRQETTEMLWNFAKKSFCMNLEVTEALSLLGEMLGGPQYVKNHMLLPHTRSADLEIHLDRDRKPLPFNLEATDSGISLTDDLMNRLLNNKPSSHKSPVDEGESEMEMGARNRTPSSPQEQSLPTGNHFAFSNGVLLTGTALSALTKSRTVSKSQAPQLKEQQTGNLKLAVQVTNRNHYCYGSKHLLGLHSMKRRQLRQIGYTVIELPYWEWFPLLRSSRSVKLSYLHHKIFGSLDRK